MISAGEASGDLHGASVAACIATLNKDIKIFGMGGSRMKDAGVRLLFNPTSMSTIGFAEAIRSACVLRRLLLRLGDVMDRQRPDVLVAIDFPGFNLPLTSMAHDRGIPVVYYICPAAWAWGKGRARKVARTATKACCILPFEADVYREAGADVEFVGHPLLDLARPALAREQALRSFGLREGAPVVALLPGSREQEIRSLFPLMLKTAINLRASDSDIRFVCPVAHTVDENLIQEYLDKAGALLDVAVTRNQVYDVLNVSDVAIVACGTATLEAALMRTPMVAVYRVSATTYLIARTLVKIPYVSLPNIIAGREIVPELIQNEATPAKLATVTRGILGSPRRRQTMQEGFDEVARKLGEPGAARRVAGIVLSVAMCS